MKNPCSIAPVNLLLWSMLQVKKVGVYTSKIFGEASSSAGRGPLNILVFKLLQLIAIVTCSIVCSCS